MDLPKSFLHAALCRRKVDLASPYPNFYHKFVLTPEKSDYRRSPVPALQVSDYRVYQDSNQQVEEVS